MGLVQSSTNKNDESSTESTIKTHHAELGVSSYDQITSDSSWHKDPVINQANDPKEVERSSRQLFFRSSNCTPPSNGEKVPKIGDQDTYHDGEDKDQSKKLHHDHGKALKPFCNESRKVSSSKFLSQQSSFSSSSSSSSISAVPLRYKPPIVYANRRHYYYNYHALEFSSRFRRVRSTNNFFPRLSNGNSGKLFQGYRIRANPKQTALAPGLIGDEYKESRSVGCKAQVGDTTPISCGTRNYGNGIVAKPRLQPEDSTYSLALQQKKKMISVNGKRDMLSTSSIICKHNSTPKSNKANTSTLDLDVSPSSRTTATFMSDATSSLSVPIVTEEGVAGSKLKKYCNLDDDESEYLFLKHLYDKRTWEMYHRITEARKRQELLRKLSDEHDRLLKLRCRQECHQVHHQLKQIVEPQKQQVQECQQHQYHHSIPLNPELCQNQSLTCSTSAKEKPVGETQLLPRKGAFPVSSPHIHNINSPTYPVCNDQCTAYNYCNNGSSCGFWMPQQDMLMIPSVVTITHPFPLIPHLPLNESSSILFTSMNSTINTLVPRTVLVANQRAKFCTPQHSDHDLIFGEME